MKPLVTIAALGALLLTELLFTHSLSGQMRVVPLDGKQGHVALGLAIRHLGNSGIFMQTTAHPDDESNGLLVMLNRGEGFRTVLATATRGNGGQNEIGPEIFEALGVLRTEELAALHRFDGAEQYFTRAVDFGYSFGLQETYDKWGREEITADYVRLIRMIRPDVVTALPPTGNAGGQHHMASSNITADAVKLAGDPTKFPEQIEEGLRPWKPLKFYQSTGFGGEAPATGQVTRINTTVFDPLLGKTYTEIGQEARSMHKCQGMAQLLALPGGPAMNSYRLVESSIPVQPEEKTLFDGIDTSVTGLARLAGSNPSRDLVDGLDVVAAAARAAQHEFDTASDQATIVPIRAGLVQVRRLRSTLASLDAAARYELDYRLARKQQEFESALLIAGDVRVDALADDGVVVPGQPVKVAVTIANRGLSELPVKQVKFEGFDGPTACALTAVTGGGGFGGGGGRGGRGGGGAPAGPTISGLKPNSVARCEPTMTIPADARVSEPYWHRAGEAGRYTLDADAPFGLPYRPSPFYADITFDFGGLEITDREPVQYRYEGDIFSGEKRMDLLVTPALSVNVTPAIAIIPSAALAAAAQSTRPTSSTAREVRVSVVNDTPSAAEGRVHLDVPKGWTATPASADVKFEHQDEAQTVRFTVRPPAGTRAGEYGVKALVESGGRTYDRGFEVIEYPHITRRHIYSDAETKLKLIDVKTQPNLTIGYVMGVGDEVPAAIEQLGAKVEMLTADQLAWGNLSRFDAIVTGIRAYERRDDLRSYNYRLLEYVKNGGTMIVQYNKFEFNEAQYGPYPAQVSANRITDEFAPVEVAQKENPIFNVPNRLGPSTWTGWVQERGTYFLGDKDPRYVDLVKMEDPFEYNRGVKTGALVEAQYGKGRWIYTGLGLWRQLPAGTDGAYQLLANLIGLSKVAPPKPAIAAPGR